VNKPTAKPAFAIVLAAGSASRFGSSKQLAELDGEALVRRVARIATEVCGNNTALVLGHDWQAIAAASRPICGFYIVNDRHADGLGTSLAQAVRSVRHVAQAIIVLLADQVMVSAQHVQTLRDTWSGAGDEIVATEYAGTTGAPVLFARGCFEELAVLQGDSGGRHLLTDGQFRVKTVRYEPAAVDIDTPEDLRRISRSVRS
jgi:molybdenum cofactor cytidylyltransferase